MVDGLNVSKRTFEEVMALYLLRSDATQADFDKINKVSEVKYHRNACGDVLLKKLNMSNEALNVKNKIDVKI